MKRVLLDTNIYGEMIIDFDLLDLKEEMPKHEDIIIYGNDLIRKELGAVPKKIKIEKRNLRVDLLNLYDEIVKHQLKINNKIKEIAYNYYEAYRELGGSKSESDILNDFIIIACASVKELDIVVSEDEKSMLAENAIRAYKLVNSIRKIRTPNFIGYQKFKNLFSSQPNKLSGSFNKLGIFLVLFSLLPNIFSFHHLLFSSKQYIKFSFLEVRKNEKR